MSIIILFLLGFIVFMTRNNVRKSCYAHTSSAIYIQNNENNIFGAKNLTKFDDRQVYICVYQPFSVFYIMVLIRRRDIK